MKVSILNILIMAKIQLNGRKLELKNKITILSEKGIKRDVKKIAVELNGKIIKIGKIEV